MLMKKSAIVVLSGPSLQNSVDKLNQRLLRGKHGTRPDIYSINKQEVIEWLLRPYGLKISHWCILSHMELENNAPSLAAFDGKIITSRVTLNAVTAHARKLITPKKPKLIDKDMVAAYKWYYALEGIKPKWRFTTRNKSWYDGKLNTLFILLSYLISAGYTRIDLYGCDGLSSTMDENIYAGQDQYTTRRVAQNQIYQDMLIFDRLWPMYSRKLISAPVYITNYSPGTNYKSIKCGC